jgi:hypothetical protein
MSGETNDPPDPNIAVRATNSVRQDWLNFAKGAYLEQEAAAAAKVDVAENAAAQKAATERQQAPKPMVHDFGGLADFQNYLRSVLNQVWMVVDDLLAMEGSAS